MSKSIENKLTGLGYKTFFNIKLLRRKTLICMIDVSSACLQYRGPPPLFGCSSILFLPILCPLYPEWLIIHCFDESRSCDLKWLPSIFVVPSELLSQTSWLGILISELAWIPLASMVKLLESPDLEVEGSAPFLIATLSSLVCALPVSSLTTTFCQFRT